MSIVRSAKDELSGIRVIVRTMAISVVARCVSQLGEAGEPDTFALPEEVADIAEGAVRNATRSQRRQG